MLKEKVSTPAYKEKVPIRIQQENVSKLEKLMQELAIIDEEARSFERDMTGGNLSIGSRSRFGWMWKTI